MHPATPASILAAVPAELVVFVLRTQREDLGQFWAGLISSEHAAVQVAHLAAVLKWANWSSPH